MSIVKFLRTVFFIEHFWWLLIFLLNSVHASGFFRCPLKLEVFGRFQGVPKETSDMKWVNTKVSAKAKPKLIGTVFVYGRFMSN